MQWKTEPEAEYNPRTTDCSLFFPARPCFFQLLLHPSLHASNPRTRALPGNESWQLINCRFIKMPDSASAKFIHICAGADWIGNDRQWRTRMDVAERSGRPRNLIPYEEGVLSYWTSSLTDNMTESNYLFAKVSNDRDLWGTLSSPL